MDTTITTPINNSTPTKTEAKKTYIKPLLIPILSHTNTEKTNHTQEYK